MIFCHMLPTGKVLPDGRHEMRCIRRECQFTMNAVPGLPCRAECKAGSSTEDYLACDHRGEMIDEVKCELCGERELVVPVFACDAHGECVLRKYKVGSHEAIADCSSCDLRLPPGAATVAKLPEELVGLAMQTAPRKDPTIHQTIASLRMAGLRNKLRVFAEPDSEVANQPGVEWHQNETKLGCRGNWIAAARWMVQHTTHPFILMLQDDASFRIDAAAALAAAINDHGHDGNRVGMWSLYTSQFSWKRMKAEERARRGWLDCSLGVRTWGSLAWLFRREALTEIASAPYFHNINPVDNKVDVMVAHWLAKLRWSSMTHVPSLATHTGKVSSIGHRHGSDNDAVEYDEFKVEYAFSAPRSDRHERSLATQKLAA